MRSVLITGGAGYFGRAFVRQLLAENNADRICIYSRNEWNHAKACFALNYDPRIRWMIGDVRDSQRLREAMRDVAIVIHAAALKRIETVDYNIMEALGTNVIGTANVVRAAIEERVVKTVLLSTDKACNPTTTYGMTKALAERLFQDASYLAGTRHSEFTVCRYGNVAGSTGSVIPIWRRAIERGDPILMTEPSATRFWMTAQQAVDLVSNAVVRGGPGEIITPDLPAYDLDTLARALGATQIRLIPMGKGEKLHEEMTPGVSSANARRMTVEELRKALRHV